MVQTYMCTVNCVETARLAMSNFLPAFPYKCRSSETFLGQLLLYSAGKFKCLLEGNPIAVTYIDVGRHNPSSACRPSIDINVCKCQSPVLIITAF